MDVKQKVLSDDDARELLEISESHFLDLKSADISPSKLTKTVSAFANTSGGEIYVGINEVEGTNGVERKWSGFANHEAANAIFQVLETMNPLGNNYAVEYLSCSSQSGLILHLTILKTQEIVFASDGKAFIRRNAQSLPVSSGEALDRLNYDKGVKSFEDEILKIEKEEITNSVTILDFLIETIPTSEPEEWVTKQRLMIDDRPTVAGVLLYSDNPQSVLPKRSAVKILRYQTKKDAERDFLAFDPLTIEGSLYSLIYSAVEKAKQIIEGIEKAGPSGMEKISYPEEALHEILTNAVLHRDYNVAADVQVRIFDNRVEIESPGRLPGHVTVENIQRTQFARNPKIVRLINKFPDPPNKDVGEGINTAFEAMGKLRLKKPTIQELEGAVLVTLKHESLASPEQLVMEYLKSEAEITNSVGRELTGIKSENSMKQVFYKLREAGQLEQVPRTPGKSRPGGSPRSRFLKNSPHYRDLLSA
ncbi:ATP-binding protein [Mesorhizobium sp. M1163]|uniref:ATP-binding protein n=1 Tax=Mesorhizobium sp. M1163 TaxID=2957065 RepID=UPI00333D36E5